MAAVTGADGVAEVGSAPDRAGPQVSEAPAEDLPVAVDHQLSEDRVAGELLLVVDRPIGEQVHPSALELDAHGVHRFGDAGNLALVQVDRLDQPLAGRLVRRRR